MEKKTKIAFIVPIASRRVAADWTAGSACFRQTLRSLFNSSNESFCVVAAGHEFPDVEPPTDPRFKFLSLDHPIPARAEITYDDRVRDKMTKIAAAWEYAKATWNPDYVMKVDWDDFISSRLVDWVASGKNEAGYAIERGWQWESGSRHWIQQMDKFDDLCGTCLIIRSDLADKSGPFMVNSEADKPRVTDHHSICPWAATSTLLLNDQHHRAAAYFQYLGQQLSPVPFRGAIYRVGNPTSISEAGRGTRGRTLRWWVGRIRRTRFITAAIRREFMLA